MPGLGLTLLYTEHKLPEADMPLFLLSEAAVNLALGCSVKHQVASSDITGCVKQPFRPVLTAIPFRK